MAEYACSRCAGSGRLIAFSNVLGGVCFKCHGSGKQDYKPAAKQPKWCVFGLDRYTGEYMRIYNVTAKSEVAAIEKARNTMANASTAYKDQYSLENARVIALAKMTDQSAIEWSKAAEPITQYYVDRQSSGLATLAQ